MVNQQKGFTIIELMVSLVLGLLISAAALTLFFSAQQSYTLQQATSELQENSNFSLEYLVKNIRMSNYNGSNVVNGQTLTSGIVLTTNNLTDAPTSVFTQAAAPTSFSNVSVNSDQLTIQYQVTAEQVTQGFFDCEGQQVISSRFVVERYYVRENGGLACVSNRDGDVKLLSGTGQLVMPGVDYFHVLLTIKNATGNLQDISIAQYDGNASIVGVQVGMIVRSNQSYGPEQYIDNTRTIKVLDQSVTLNQATQQLPRQFLRDVFIQTVALRNALGS